MLTVLAIIGVVIVVVLTVIAINLRQKVKAVEAEQAEQEKAFAEQKQEKNDSMNKSVQILAQGLLKNELSKTEGAIRISALLTFLGVNDDIKEEYSAFFQLAEASAHIPILDKWKALSSKEKMHYDNERMELENQYGDFVVDAAKRIIGKRF